MLKRANRILFKAIEDNQVFKGAVRNIDNGLKGKMGIFKGDNSLDALFLR